MNPQIKELAQQLAGLDDKWKKHHKNPPPAYDETGKYIQNYLKLPEYLAWHKEYIRLGKEQNILKNKINSILWYFCPGAIVWSHETLKYEAKKENEIRTD